ncbi:MAG: hypothetical protein ACYC2Y_03295 [Armatimonadota bacterium]
MSRKLAMHGLFLLCLLILIPGCKKEQPTAPGAPTSVGPVAPGAPGGPGAGAPGMPTPGGPGAPTAPGGPGMPGSAPAAGAAPAVSASIPSGPAVPLSAVVSGGITRNRMKNWDGAVTEFLSFKYRLSSGDLAVQLPASYAQKEMTKSAWETTFQVYAVN